MIRVSFGLYNTFTEIDFLIDAPGHISRGDYQGQYTQDKATGEYMPKEWQPDYSRFFSFQI